MEFEAGESSRKSNCKMGQQRVYINVSGEVYETYENTLSRFPQTLLGDKNKRFQYQQKRLNLSSNKIHGDKNDSKFYFFNRHRKSFEAILFYYQSCGMLYRPSDVSIEIFLEECRFFQISEKCLHDMRDREGAYVIEEEEKERQVKLKYGEGTYRHKIWNFLEYPESSYPARIYGITTLSLISVSVIASCMETIEIFQYGKNHSLDNPWFVVELVLNILFLLEIIVRIIFAPDKLRFFRSIMNGFDILAVVPYFIVFTQSRSKATSLAFLRVFRFLRIFRMFRLSKHSHNIKLIGAILKESFEDFKMLFLCMFITITAGASIMYYLEHDVANTMFTSVPESMWWGVQTLVTVGYGDIVAITLQGKLFSSVFMIFGVLTISLPVLSIVLRFSTQWKNRSRG